MKKLFIYFSSCFHIWIKSGLSSFADWFSVIASRALSLTNECSFHFLHHQPQLPPQLLFQLLYIYVPLPTLNGLETEVGEVRRELQMKMFSSYPGCHEVWSAHADFFQSLNKGRMWCYNILGDNRGRISHLLWFHLITAGSVLLTSYSVFLKMENPEPILRVKSFEWRKSVDCFGLNIKANPSRVVKKNVFFPYWVYINTIIWKAPYIKVPSGQKV